MGVKGPVLVIRLYIDGVDALQVVVGWVRPRLSHHPVLPALGLGRGVLEPLELGFLADEGGTGGLGLRLDIRGGQLLLDSLLSFGMGLCGTLVEVWRLLLVVHSVLYLS